jgi:hypothetical protein
MEWLVQHLIGDDVEGNHLNITPKVISEMIPFRMTKGRKLYRGHFSFNFEQSSEHLGGKYPELGAPFVLKGGPTSWSYDENVARGFSEIDNFGYVIECTFKPEDTIFDNLSLNHTEQQYLEDHIHEATGYVRDMGRETEVLVKKGTYNCKIIDFHDSNVPDKETTAGPSEERRATKMRQFSNWVEPTLETFTKELDSEDESVVRSGKLPELYATGKVVTLTDADIKKMQRGEGATPNADWLVDRNAAPKDVDGSEFRYLDMHHKEGQILDRFEKNEPLTMPIVSYSKEHQRYTAYTGRHRIAYSHALNLPTKVFCVDSNLFYQLENEAEGKKPITAGMLDYPRKQLPKEVWLYEPENPLPRLQPKLRAKILSEARYRLSKFGAKLIGAMLYGGAATYQYKEGADIDVSLYIDWDQFKGDEEILQEAFKNVVVPWPPYEIHLFVKPSNQTEQVEVADATYDVLKDEWKLPPLVLPRDFDPEVFFKPMVEMAEKKAQQIDLQMGALAREWTRLKKLYRALREGARDEDVIRDKIHLTKKVLLDRLDVLCENFVDIWKGRRKLHDELRKRFVQDNEVGRYERFQLPEVTWKYLDEMGYVEYLKVLCKAQEAGTIEYLLDHAIPVKETDDDEDVADGK